MNHQQQNWADYSGIVRSMGLQAFLSKYLCLNPTQTGLDKPGSSPTPVPLPCNFFIARKTSVLSLILPLSLSLTLFCRCCCPSSSSSKEETNRSFNLLRLWTTNKSLQSLCFWSSTAISFGVGSVISLQRLLELRVSSMRRVVFLRGNWTNGLVLGLLVGLWATPHCVARILNFCNVAIHPSFLSVFFRDIFGSGFWRLSSGLCV